MKNWMREKIQLSNEYQELAQQEINYIPVHKRINRELVLSSGERLTDFISCSYLGIDQDKRLVKALSNSAEKFGINFSVARSRFYIEILDELEYLLGKMFNDSKVVIFQNLHSCHQSLIPLLASGELPSYPLNNNGVMFILDRHVHSSIQINRGVMQQFGIVKIVNSNNMNELTQAFDCAAKEKVTPVLFIDSIGSMGGCANIKELYELTDKYEGYLYVDDAHGMSIFGKYGYGYALTELNDLLPRLVLTTSLSKTFGTGGAIVIVRNEKIQSFIKRYAQTYIFGGPLASPIVESSIASAKIHLSDELLMLQNNLWDNVCYFDNQVTGEVINYRCTSPIRAVLIGNENEAIMRAKLMRSKGIAVTTAMYPTVEKNNAILRIAISATHTREQINKLALMLNS